MRWAALLGVFALVATLFVAFEAPVAAQGASECGPNVNKIACENQKPGTDPYEWDIEGAGDPSIQGFATDISVNVGSTIDFKIDTDAANYTIDIYRTGWYQGLGARHIASVAPSATLPQIQPECISDLATELYDCGTWNVSASWNVPSNAVSGVYIASLRRTDTGGQSHITFIVREDGNTSDILFQTSDPTWHAYNTYGGSDFYQGAANGRAYKISYNRPFATRGGVEKRDFYFSSEYATVRFLERNGYDMSYIAGVDTDRRGGELLNHDVFLSVGHDEYWSGAQRANIEAARDAGVNLQFLTGNEGYWRTRYEPSADGSNTDYRTLVSYKETWGNSTNRGGGKIDSSSPEWTGTWRDPRFADASQGGHSPENALTGTMYQVNNVYLPVTVNAEEGKTRLWRNTSLASLAPGTSAELAEQTVGYESNEDIDNGFRPEGLIRLSTTVGATPEYLTDYGNTVVAGTTKHHLTLYRAASGALVFSSASVQWSWGLDSEHDGQFVAADPRMQQAQVNLLADMGAQPTTLMTGLVAAAASSDTTPPTTTITSPAAGAAIANGATVTVTGTASDVGGRVAGVEVSTDGGQRWHPAEGTTDWTYTYVQRGAEGQSIIARAIDDSANFASEGVKREIVVNGPFSVFGEEKPAVASADDSGSVEVGLRFTPESDGFVTGVRFYKGAANTGTHTGALWDAAGARLASVTFTNESPEGWQTALFATPVAVNAGVQYTVSYSAPNGGYSMTDQYWPYSASSSSPLSVSSAVGTDTAGVYGVMGARPTQTWRESNYFVDVVFDKSDSSPLRIAARTPQADAASIALDAAVTATFTRDADPSTVSIVVTDAAGATVPGTVSYTEGTRTARFSPAEPFAPSTRYTVAPSGADAEGVALAEGSGWSFTTQTADLPEGECPCSLFRESERPAIESDSDRDLVTLGVRFTVDVPGQITALKFFKGADNAGPRTMNLWRVDGTPLATANVVDEPSTGWQTVMLPQPIDVVPGTTYVASYLAPQGGYAVTLGQFGSNGYTRGPLTVPANGGAFTYADGFPAQSSTTNYAVDVVFSAVEPAPAPVTLTPASGAIDVSAESDISVVFSQPVAAGVTGVVRANGAVVAGEWSLSADEKTLNFAPDASLPPGAAMSVTVADIVGVSGVAGADVTWSFSVAAENLSVTTLFGDAVPQIAAESTDGASVELATAFRSSVPGAVRAIRFYKGDGNGGVHVGSLWASGGSRLAEVTFVGETASGWQRALLDVPVQIEPGLVYTVSYLAPQGRYAHTGGALASPVSSGPLTTEAPDNGRYRYGTGGVVPTDSWNSTNYFVDVEFVVDTQAPEAPPVVTEVAPARDAVQVPIDAGITATLDIAPQAQSVGMTVTGPSGPVAGSASFDGATRTVTFTPADALASFTPYTATVTLDGAALDSWSFRTAPRVVTGVTESLFGSLVPEIASAPDADPVEVGTAFQVTAAGTVTALRFYKGVQNLGVHRGTLWAEDGSILARVTFAGETASGWQRAELDEPVDIAPGATYVVSYFAPQGRFAIAPGYFDSPQTNGRISAPAGANGRFFYGADGGFPTGSWGSSSYFVDAEVTFPESVSPPAPTPTPTPTETDPSTDPEDPPAPEAVSLTSRTPDAGASDIAPTTTVSTALASAQGGATITVTTSTGPVDGVSDYDDVTRIVTFTPAEPLLWETVYTVVVSVPGATVTDGSWTFTTAAEPEVVNATTMFGDATPQNAWWNDPDAVQVATRFSVDVAGDATGVRFYKGSANTGEHTGYLWRDGVALAEVEFSDETAEGWQTAEFSEPVALEPGVEYRVGLYSTTGRYAVDLGGLAQPMTVGHFAIPANGSAYTYSRSFPDALVNHNYWVDVLFVPES